jgi:hypothetical protein
MLGIWTGNIEIRRDGAAIDSPTGKGLGLRGRAVVSLAVAMVTSTLLFYNITSTPRMDIREMEGRGRVDLPDLYPVAIFKPAGAADWSAFYPAHRRYWSDYCSAARSFLDAKPDAPSTDLSTASLLCQRRTAAAIGKAGIRPWEFWRTVAASDLRSIVEATPPPEISEDRGRAFLASLGFELLDGVAPLFPYWMAALAFAPVTLWIAWEFAGAGRLAAGCGLLLLLALSPFVGDCLVFVHSGLGFYIGAWGVLVAMSCHVTLAPRITITGLLSRAFLAGLILSVFMWCRSGVAMLVPGFLLALVIGARRLGRPWLVLGLAVTLLVPLLLSAPRSHHAVWHALWEGMGDFDRTKRHVWSDIAAGAELAAAGVDPGPDATMKLVSPVSEAYFRRVVIAEITQDPLWYAQILVRRIGATLFQTKLWPFRHATGRTFALKRFPNEGQIDGYYGWVRTVDLLGIGGRTSEIPIHLLIAPTALLGWIAVRGRAAERARRGLLCLSCVAGGASTSPVLITTASAFEIQIFALVYFIGAVLLVEVVYRSLAAPPGPPAALSTARPGATPAAP